MNKKISLLSKIYLPLCIFFATAAVALRINMMQNAYDHVNGFYTADTLHSIFGYTLAGLVAILAVTAYIYIKEENCSVFPSEGLFVKAASVLCGCASGGFIIYVFAKAVLPVASKADAGDLATLAFCAVAMLYFFTLGKKASFRSILCIFNALVLLSIVLVLYFDRTVSFVNHSIVLCFAACIFSSLTFAAEANFALERKAYRRYLAYAASAVVLSLASSIPDIVYCITKGYAVLTDVYYDIIILAYGIYHLARLTEIALKKETK